MGLLEYNSICYMDDEELFSCIAPLLGLFLAAHSDTKGLGSGVGSPQSELGLGEGQERGEGRPALPNAVNRTHAEAQGGWGGGKHGGTHIQNKQVIPAYARTDPAPPPPGPTQRRLRTDRPSAASARTDPAPPPHGPTQRRLRTDRPSAASARTDPAPPTRGPTQRRLPTDRPSAASARTDPAPPPRPS
uniref:Uncharacterized protein n=1 Tax=Knipowitschia caucasica TaxID=637954 RepID=A0AAV2KBR3_KNICA